MVGLKVLSCFDGMSCGFEALKKANIPVSEYYASEIDKFAIQIAKKNHPEIKFIGDIKNWKKWDFSKNYFDLIIGASPCQGFSQGGLKLNFEDHRSKLYFEFESILKKYKPKYWLLENVKMKEEWENVITERLGKPAILIDSSLLSAQKRKRLYWANFPIRKPEFKSITLRDILETPYDIRLSRKGIYRICQNKSGCLTAGSDNGGNHSEMDLIGLEKNNFEQLKKSRNFVFNVYSEFNKKPSINFIKYKKTNTKIAVDDYYWRRYTPIECERLQTLPDNYTQGVTNTQRYKMLANGWTSDVISHIFKELDFRRLKPV